MQVVQPVEQILTSSTQRPSIMLSQPERISPLLTDLLKQIKETLGKFFTGLLKVVFSLENNQDVINSQLFNKSLITKEASHYSTINVFTMLLD